MVSFAAQQYIADMLEIYMKDGETTVFKMKDIGPDRMVWKELEDAGIVKVFSHLGTVEFDPEANDQMFYPDDM